MDDGRARTLEEVGKEFDVTRSALFVRSRQKHFASFVIRAVVEIKRLSGLRKRRLWNYQRDFTAVAGLVTEGASVADIGTDHGYIPIHLMGTELITESDSDGYQ